jgi:hypothetical protein
MPWKNIFTVWLSDISWYIYNIIYIWYIYIHTLSDLIWYLSCWNAGTSGTSTIPGSKRTILLSLQ